jgi:hypothetical protein
MAKSKGDREKLAQQRVNEYFTKLLNQQAQFVEITGPVQEVLRDKYDYTINPETLDQVLLQAAKIRLSSDSTSKAAQPNSVVPVPNPADTTKK